MCLSEVMIKNEYIEKEFVIYYMLGCIFYNNIEDVLVSKNECILKMIMMGFFIISGIE